MMGTITVALETIWLVASIVGAVYAILGIRSAATDRLALNVVRRNGALQQIATLRKIDNIGRLFIFLYYIVIVIMLLWKGDSIDPVDLNVLRFLLATTAVVLVVLVIITVVAWHIEESIRTDKDKHEKER